MDTTGPIALHEKHLSDWKSYLLHLNLTNTNLIFNFHGYATMPLGFLGKITRVFLPFQAYILSHVLSGDWKLGKGKQV